MVQAVSTNYSSVVTSTSCETFLLFRRLGREAFLFNGALLFPNCLHAQLGCPPPLPWAFTLTLDLTTHHRDHRSFRCVPFCSKPDFPILFAFSASPSFVLLGPRTGDQTDSDPNLSFLATSQGRHGF